MIMLKMSRGGRGVWICSDCQYETKKKFHMMEHIESKHIQDGLGYQCEVCSNVYKTRSNLRVHIKGQHYRALSVGHFKM